MQGQIIIPICSPLYHFLLRSNWVGFGHFGSVCDKRIGDNHNYCKHPEEVTKRGSKIGNYISQHAIGSHIYSEASKTGQSMLP